MPRALIGKSSFIGENLAAQAHFDEKSDGPLRAGSWDLVVCAGAGRADRDPERDAAAVQRLIQSLGEVQAKQFILVSSTDVYPRPEMVDEDAPIDAAAGTEQGRARRELEQFCIERFGATVLRLPLAFGPGLDENVLFDLLMDREVDELHPDGVFQYYAVAQLWRDANMALERGIAVLNLVGEPVPTRELSLRCFGRELTQYPAAPPAVRDVRSKHAPLWGGQPFGYLYAKERVLQQIADFIDHERAL
jgi:hypothetical protein